MTRHQKRTTPDWISYFLGDNEKPSQAQADKFSSLYKHYLGSATSYIRDRLHSNGFIDEEDIYTDAINALFKKRDDVKEIIKVNNCKNPRDQYKVISTYLFSIINNIISSVNRKNARERRILRRPNDADWKDIIDTFPSETQIDSYEEISMNEVLFLRHVLNKLPYIYREVIKLRIENELPYNRMANVLGKQPATLRKLYQRGLEMFRKLTLTEAQQLLRNGKWDDKMLINVIMKLT